jgi:putative ABC transport system permease protein
MDEIMKLGLAQTASAYVFIAVLLILVRKKGISRSKEILISSIRMTVQLVLAGYVLVYIFKISNPLATLGTIAVMECFAIYSITGKVRTPGTIGKRLKRYIAISMAVGTLLSVSYFLFVVVRVTPWYNPRYFIPIAGMFIGNSMTAVSLSLVRLVDGIDIQRSHIETSLMLGATPTVSSRIITDSAFDSAILPTINSMVGMGIVFLPGMMTGQILSGTSPLTAIQYQIATMLGIAGSVAICTVTFLHLGYRAFFNEESQLVQGQESDSR